MTQTVVPPAHTHTHFGKKMEAELILILSHIPKRMKTKKNPRKKK